jgi:hypothetical protein
MQCPHHTLRELIRVGQFLLVRSDDVDYPLGLDAQVAN